MWQEFKKFAVRGNVVDMAVGVVMGAAFGAIVKALVDNLIMPPIGLLTGGVDFGQQYVVLRPPTPAGNYATTDEMIKAGAVLLRYGLVLNAVVSFLLVAVAVFALVRVVQKVAPPPVEAPKTKECPECAMDVPVKARRCGHCTAIIGAAAAAE